MIEHWSDAYVDVLRASFPLDIGNRPIYLSTPGELRGDWHLDGSLAYTSTMLDWHLQASLERDGRWQGPGFAIVICKPCFIEGSTDELLGHLAHEIAHCLVASRSSFQRMASDFVPSLGPGFIADKPTPIEATSLIKDYILPPWMSHEIDFIRASLHLHARLWERGHMPLLERMYVAGDCYRLSGPMEYRKHLIDELKKERDTPIVEILRSHPPEQFTDLWQRDTQTLIIRKSN